MVHLTEHYVYWEFHESVAYAGIKLTGLPQSITINEIELLLKSEFHITFVNLEDIAKIIDQKNSKTIEKEILEEATQFLKTNNLNNFKITNQFRFVRRDVRKTIIVMCELPGADKFFDILKDKYKKDLPLQPFHITLYATPKDRGIGLLSDAEVQQYSHPVQLNELKGLGLVKKK